jgi:hypothetical protein
MNRWRVGEDRGSKETDGCPLTDVGFGEDRGGSGDDSWDEDLASLAQLADMTSFSIPVYVTDHTGPPKVLNDGGFGCVECFMAKGVVRGVDDRKSSTWWDD